MSAYCLRHVWRMPRRSRCSWRKPDSRLFPASKRTQSITLRLSAVTIQILGCQMHGLTAMQMDCRCAPETRCNNVAYFRRPCHLRSLRHIGVSFDLWPLQKRRLCSVHLYSPYLTASCHIGDIQPMCSAGSMVDLMCHIGCRARRLCAPTTQVKCITQSKQASNQTRHMRCCEAVKGGVAHLVSRAGQGFQGAMACLPGCGAWRLSQLPVPAER